MVTITVRVRNRLCWNLLKDALNVTVSGEIKFNLRGSNHRDGTFIATLTFATEQAKQSAEERIRQLENPFTLIEQGATPKGG